MSESRGDISAADFAGLTREETIARLRDVVGALGLERRFALLHELGLYAGSESISGEGSTLQETRALRAALPDLLDRHGVRRLLDVPCGDAHWMRTLDLPGIEYVGVDIVPAIVEANRLRGETGRRYVVLDATRDPLPATDMIFCRDLLIHLRHDDVIATLANFAAADARLLMASHFADCRENPDIVSGDFRPINLCRAPFHLPPPIETVNERSRMADGAFRDRSMALWRLDDLRSAPAAAP